MENEAQINRVLAYKATIDAALARLQSWSDEHFDLCPGDIIWADAEGIGRIAYQITELTAEVFNEAE